MPIAAITGVHGFLPDDVLSNADLEKMVDTNDEWIVSRTGIKERRILKGEGLGTSYMGVKAVTQLLEKTGTNADEIELLVCATVTPDSPLPSTANIICDKVGIQNVISFDMVAACSGFLYALVTACQFIQSGAVKKAIVVGADKMSSIIDYEDRATCIIFGDGAGAVLLEASDDEEYGVRDFILDSDGAGRNHLYITAGGSAKPASIESVHNKEHFVIQDGKTVFKHAVTKMADVSAEIMERNGLTGKDVQWLVPHQANKRIIDATARKMDLSPDKVMLNIESYGNTTAGTIPLCLWDWEKQLKKGDNLILSAFGGGFTWGAVYVKWSYDGGQ